MERLMVLECWVLSSALIPKGPPDNRKMVTARLQHIPRWRLSAPPAQSKARASHQQNKHPHCLRQLPVLSPLKSPPTLKRTRWLQIF